MKKFTAILVALLLALLCMSAVAEKSEGVMTYA